MRYFALIILFVLNTKFLYSQNFNTTLSKIKKTYNSFNSVHYEVIYKIKFFDNIQYDTISGDCFLNKNLDDSIFKLDFLYNRIDLKTNITKSYLQNSLYVTNHLDSTVTKFNVLNNELFPIRNNIDGSFIDFYSLTERLIKNIVNKHNTIQNHDSVYNGKKYRVIKIIYPDDPEDLEFHDESELYFIDFKKSIISYVFKEIYYKDQIENKTWEFKNTNFEKFGTELLFKNLNNKSQKYLRINYSKIKEKISLKEGEKFPIISGFSFKQNTLIYDSSKINDKIKIIDFWFASCFNCIESNKTIQNIYKKYKNEIDILNINNVDYDQSKLESAKKFILRENIIFENILLSSKYNEAITIRSYPTLFVLNKNRIIIKIIEGAKVENFEILDNVIYDLLKK